MSTVVGIKTDAPADSDAPFQVGDIVALKSNKAPMTVAAVIKQRGGNNYRIKVEWMNSADDLNSAEFDARQLKMADSSDAV